MQKNLWNKWRKKEKEKGGFFYKRQDCVMSKVLDHLILTGERIDNEAILYFPESFPFTIDEFTLLFQNILNFAKHKDKVYTNSDIDFPNIIVYIKYEDVILELFEMSGQGMFSTIEITENWEERYDTLDYNELEFIETLQF